MRVMRKKCLLHLLFSPNSNNISIDSSSNNIVGVGGGGRGYVENNDANDMNTVSGRKIVEVRGQHIVLTIRCNVAALGTSRERTLLATNTAEHPSTLC